jgi:hypothetical protein
VNSRRTHLENEENEENEEKAPSTSDGAGDGQLFDKGVDDSPPKELLDLIDRWNALDRSVAKAKVGRAPPPKAVLAAWTRIQREPELRSIFADLDKLFEAISRARYLHGKQWFRLPWLSTAGKTGELNAQKLIDGAYERNENDGRPIPNDSPARVREPGRYDGLDRTSDTATAGGTSFDDP